MVAGFSWVDWALAAVLLVSAMVGLWRGLVFELLSLVGWAVAFVVAKVCSAMVAPWLPVGAPDSWARLALAFGLTFFATLILWSLLAKVARMLVSATPLSVLDRALGAAFGLARGLLILLLVALLVGVIPPASRSVAWQSSRASVWLQAALHGLKPWVPTVDLRNTQDA